jgi:hypothetical protein
VIADPLLAGADHVNATDVDVRAPIVGAAGAAGACAANADADADEYAEVPSPLVAATRNSYDDPAVNPVTVTDVAVDGSRVNVDHDGAPTTRYCTV